MSDIQQGSLVNRRQRYTNYWSPATDSNPVSVSRSFFQFCYKGNNPHSQVLDGRVDHGWHLYKRR